MIKVIETYRGWPISRDGGGCFWEHGGPFETAEEARIDIDARPAEEPANLIEETAR